MIFTLTLNPALDRELTVPAFAFDEVLRASRVQVDVGGKGFNVSRVLRALGTESVAMGFAGGRTGEALQDGLHALGIETEFVPIEGETRTNVSIVTPAGGRYLKVNEQGPTVSEGAQQRLLERVEARAQPGAWWVLAGSLPPGISPTYYATLIDRLQRRGAHVFLDTSGAALQQGLAARPFLSKPNEVELAELTGQPVSSADEAVRAVRTITPPPRVIVSLGARGALLVDGDRAWHATPPPIEARNPIGAGDSLVAGVVAALSRGEALPAALALGVACGTATASLSGTAVGTREQVDTYLNDVSIRELQL